jgi:hypothetical protein
MIGDMKRFTPGVGVEAGFLWIIEVMPGVYASEDVTSTFVKQGNYWPSYNVPFTSKIYQLGGFQDAFDKHGDEYR